MRAVLLFLHIFSLSLAAQTESQISGKLLGYDGSPMRLAHVHLIKEYGSAPLLSHEVKPDGSFHISTSVKGPHFLQFTGVSHRQKLVPLLIEEPLKLELNVRLSTNTIVDTFENVKVLGNFNNFKVQSAREMEKLQDGTYSLELETDQPTLEYQLAGVEKAGRTIDGTDSESYKYDGDGDYSSIKKVVGGKVRVLFDPKKLVRSETTAKVDFSEAEGKEARFYSFYSEVDEQRRNLRDYLQKFKKGEEDLQEIFDWITWYQSFQSKVIKEQDPTISAYLVLSSRDLNFDHSIARTMLQIIDMRKIPSTSPAWSMLPSSLLYTLDFPYSGEKEQQMVEKILDTHSDSELKATLLFGLLNRARYSKRPEKERTYYERMVKEYPGHRLTRRAKMEFSPDKNITVGKNVPEFSLASMENPQVKYSPKSFGGKYVLLDFWATWCPPCIAEMKYLHKSFERFGKRNFSILSISLDQDSKDVNEFRRDLWKMPWNHSFLENGFQNELAERFEVTGIPATVLIDDKGKIVATGSDLKGDNLIQTLEKFLGNQKPPPVPRRSLRRARR
jgi:thiol-disulfide isomerase/thioredoxin